MADDCERAALLAALRLLFGPEVQITNQFLDYVQPSGVRRAYRLRVLETHPDLGRGARESFLAVRDAYGLLMEHLLERGQGRESAVPLTNEPGSGFNSRPSPSDDEPLVVRPFALVRERRVFAATAAGERFYRGAMPRRVLRFGHFLYYAGLTNWRTISRILIWQRIQRPRLGEVCRMEGLLSTTEISRVLTRQPARLRFGETAVAMGLLSRAQVNQLLARQARLQKRFGTILVERRLIDRAVLQELLIRFQRHNAAMRHGGGSRGGRP